MLFQIEKTVTINNRPMVLVKWDNKSDTEARGTLLRTNIQTKRVKGLLNGVLVTIGGAKKLGFKL